MRYSMWFFTIFFCLHSSKTYNVIKEIGTAYTIRKASGELEDLILDYFQCFFTLMLNVNTNIKFSSLTSLGIKS